MYGNLNATLLQYDIGKGVQMFGWGDTWQEIKSKLLHPYRIYKYLIVQCKVNTIIMQNVLCTKWFFYVCENVFNVRYKQK